MWRTVEDCYFRLDCKKSLNVEIAQTSLYPPIGLPSFYIIPTLYDDIENKSYTVPVLNLIVICIIVMTFKFYSKYFHFDSLTWHPIVAFSMIIGVSNTRDPVRFGETIVFMSLISVGFFFGGDLISGLFEVKFVQRIERKMETVDDVTKNNVTFIFFHSSEKQGLQGFSNVKWKRGLRNRNMYMNMLLYKNGTVPWLGALAGLPCPERFMINREVYAEQSKTKHSSSAEFRYVLPCNCPWLHQMNYNLLKYYENHFEKTQEMNVLQFYLKNHVIKDSIQMVILKIEEESEDEIENLDNMWVIVATSNVLSIFILIVEILSNMYI